jgi:hypothetical protein
VIKGNAAYKGVYRDPPPYADHLADAHPVNQAWQWWLNESSSDAEEHGLIRDLDRARSLVETYKQYLGETLDVIELCIDDEEPAGGGVLLGYDIELGFYNSLLWDGVRVCADEDAFGGYSPDLRTTFANLRPLSCLVEIYFQPRLNENGLFGESDTAKHFVECINSIESFVPDYFEQPPHEWQVIAVYSVAQRA